LVLIKKINLPVPKQKAEFFFIRYNYFTNSIRHTEQIVIPSSNSIGSKNNSKTLFSIEIIILTEMESPVKYT